MEPDRGAGSCDRVFLPPTDDGTYRSANWHKYAQGGAVYRWFLGRVHAELARHVARFRPATVLDAGCGEGFVAADLRRRRSGLEITGVDADEAAISYARRHFGDVAAFDTGDLYALPFADRSFDVAVCSEVLEHLDRPAQAVRELARVARLGVVVSVPREPAFDALNRLGQALGAAPDPGHVRHWTPRAFARFLRPLLGDVEVSTRHLFTLASAPVGPGGTPPRPGVAEGRLDTGRGGGGAGHDIR